MRWTGDSKLPVVFFAGDLPGGGLLLEVPGEDELMSSKDLGLDDEPWFNKNGTEVFYPNWVDW